MSSSWFPRSPPNPSNSDDERSPPHSPTATATAAKPDFSVITQTIGRQLHNVASFLAPPPKTSYSSSSSSESDDDSGDVSTSSYRGLKNDLAEIGGSFKTGLSLLSSNKAVSEISKLASNLLHFDHANQVRALGITDKVVHFAQEISRHPEFWVDYSLSLQHKEFKISNHQKDHAQTIEELVPSLATLRHKIESYISEEKFWVIYFVLLLPRLNENDYRLLSTPEIVQVREELLMKLRNKENTATGEPEIRNLLEINSTQQIKKAIESSSTEKNELSQEEEESLSDVVEVEDNNNNNNNKKSGNKHSQSGSASESGDWVRLDGNERNSRYRERSSSDESGGWTAVDDVDL